MADRKFDIFEVIKEIEGLQTEFFDKLADYEIRQIAPYVIMKWMAGVKDRNQLIAINDNVNRLVFAMSKHPKLMYKLLMASATRKDKRVSWIKRPKADKSSASVNIIKEYYGCSYRDALKYVKVIPPEKIIDMAELLGTNKETMTKLKKEINGK
jgi:uncharacterized FlaG/YvyC family protein